MRNVIKIDTKERELILENSNISVEEIQKSDAIIKAISNYYTSRIVGQKNYKYHY